VFREQWIHEETLLNMQRLVLSVKELKGDIIEVGSWEGRSTVYIANAAFPEKVHAIDHFQGSYSDGDYSGRLAEERGDIFEVFQQNVRAFTHGGNVEVHRKSWQEWAQENKVSVKFAHLDAEHSYEQAKELIEVVLKMMCPGGIICGDDYSPLWQGTQNAVDLLLPDRQVNAHAMWYYQIPF
jgi:predicted O-methyltransferase YrrM